MADKRSAGGFNVPFVFAGGRSRTGTGAEHYLTGAPHSLVNRLSLINDAPDFSPLSYGFAFDFTGDIPPYSATADAAAFQLIGTSATLVPQTNVGGQIQLASQAADNAVSVLRGNAEAFRYSTTKDLWFVCQFSPGDADDSDLLMGLGISTYAATAIDTLPTDGIFFFKTETATVMSFSTRASSVSTTTASTVTVNDDVLVEVAFRINSGTVEAFFNGTRIAAHTTNIPATSVILAPYLGVQAGSAGGDSMNVDGWLCAQER